MLKLGFIILLNNALEFFHEFLFFSATFSFKALKEFCETLILLNCGKDACSQFIKAHLFSREV
jgi:hypothetical protein